MTVSSHPTVERLTDFGLGRLSDIDSVEIESHLISCETCQEKVATVPDDRLISLVRKPTSPQLNVRIVTRSEFDELRPLAQGGLGVVALARDRHFGRDVAVKRIRPEIADNPSLQRRFLREAAITGRLEHPGIAPVYGIGEDDAGQPCYTMRFVPGKTLQDAIETLHAEGSVTPLRIRPLLNRFISLCNTVAYAHSRGVIHRDIKPSNVAIGTYGETILLDWGLAHAEGEPEIENDSPSRMTNESSSPFDPFHTKTGTVMGTPGYMAPEQSTAGVVGPAADVYSLGSTLQMLLSASAPTALSAIARKAMAPRIEDRYGSARELGTDVERWLADQPVQAHPDSVTALIRRWLRHHPTAATVAVATLMLTLLGTTIGAALLAKEQNRTEFARQAEMNQRRRTEQAETETLDAYRDGTDDAIVELIGSRSELGPAEIAYLEGAARRWTSLARREGDDRRSRVIRAEGAYELAHIWNRLERRSEARAAFQEAVVLYRELIRDGLNGRDHRRTLAKAHAGLGRQLMEAGETTAAVGEYSAAGALQDALLIEEPTSAVLHYERGLSESGLANHAFERGEHREAKSRFLNAGTHFQQAVSTPESRLIWRQHAADNQLNLGYAHCLLKEADAADTSFRESIREYESLAAQDPARTDYSRGIARGHVGLGSVHRDRGQFARAQVEFETARDVFGRTLAKYPALPDVRRELASVHFNLMGVKRLDRRPAEAVVDAVTVCDHYRHLVTTAPDAVRDREQLAKGNDMLELLLLNLGRRAEAEKASLEARAEWQTLADRHPGQHSYRVNLAGNLGNHASALADDGKPSEALEWLDKSLKLLATVPDAAKVENAVRNRVNNRATRASVLETLNRLDDALADWTAAIADCDPAECKDLRASRALCLARLGKFNEATLEAQVLLREGKLKANDVYLLAGVYALQASGDDDNRKTALQLLNQSISKGFKDGARLRADATFQSLHQLPDFKALLAKLSKS